METITVILALIIGTIIFAVINTVFEIWYLSFRAMIGEWFTCVVIAGILVQALGGILGGLFSLIWFLIRIAIIVVVITYIVKLIRNKLNKK